MTKELRVLIVNEIRPVNGIITGHYRTVSAIVEQATRIQIDEYTFHPIYMTLGNEYSVTEFGDRTFVTVPPTLEVKALGLIDIDNFPFEVSLVPFGVRLYDLLSKLDIDVVHTTSPYGKTDITTTIFSKLNHIPHISSVHTTFEKYFRTYSAKMAINVLNKFGISNRSFQDKFSNFIGEGLEKLIGFLGKKVLQASDFVLYSNKPDIEPYDLDTDKTAEFMRGIDTELFAPIPGRKYSSSNPDGEIGTAEHPVRLIYVGRIQDEKNVLRFIDIMDELDNMGIHAHLTMIGEGYEKSRLLTEIGQDRLTLAGQLSHLEISRLMNESDIYVHPALHESYGNTIAEAKSSGLPLVAFAYSGATHKHLIDGENGFSVSKDNGKDWAEAIAKITRDTNLRIHMGTISRNDVLEKYLSWKDVVEYQIAVKWVNLYKQIK